MPEAIFVVIAGWIASGLPGPWIDDTIYTFRSKDDERIVLTVSTVDPASEGATSLQDLLAETQTRLAGFDTAEVIETSNAPAAGYPAAFLHMRISGGADVLEVRVLLLQRAADEVAQIVMRGPAAAAATLHAAWEAFLGRLTVRTADPDR